MKKILMIAALFAATLVAGSAKAQVRISLGLNIGSQPDWGPVGYDHVDYYYMPDVDAYYDVPAHQYVYMDNNVWVHRAYLPTRYRTYDMYHGYKVVVNRPNPWLRHSYYRTTYASYRGRQGQAVIRDSRDARYQNHWNGNNGNHNGRGGNGPGNGRWHIQGNDHGHGNPHGGGDHGRGDHGHGHH